MRWVCLVSLALVAAVAFAAENTPTTKTPPTTRPTTAETAAPAVAEPTTAAKPTTTTTPAGPETGGTIRGKNLWETLSRGGPLMIPILICSLFGVAFAIERFVALRQKAVAPRDLAEGVLEALNNGSPAEAMRLCEERPSSLARVLAAGLRLAGAPRDEITTAMQEAGERELWNLERFAKPLNVIAGVAPLLGLLGTVWGMIIAFDVVAQKGALGDPRQLANGIATALLTTLAGLSVAIPCYVLHHYFRDKSDRLVVEIEETASRVLAALRGAARDDDPTPNPGDRGPAPHATD